MKLCYDKQMNHAFDAEMQGYFYEDEIYKNTSLNTSNCQKQPKINFNANEERSKRMKY